MTPPLAQIPEHYTPQPARQDRSKTSLCSSRDRLIDVGPEFAKVGPHGPPDPLREHCALTLEVEVDVVGEVDRTQPEVASSRVASCLLAMRCRSLLVVRRLRAIDI